MTYRKPSIFCAIPCGDFYCIQAAIISRVSKLSNINLIIAEDDLCTKGLWDKIKEQINSSDLFMADISSGSPNIILELGYALREKNEKNIGIFIANSIAVPSDLNGFVLQKYSSSNDFQNKLVKWLCKILHSLDTERFNCLEKTKASFVEDFQDQDIFYRRWSVPPGGSCVFGGEGLRISNMHLPMLTTTLAILRDCEFSFKAKIESLRIGWVVKGILPQKRFYPEFCLMFNLDDQGILTPHILNMEKLNPSTLYQVFEKQRKRISNYTFKNRWINITTTVRGDFVEIKHDNSIVFSADFSKEPYVQYYHSSDRRGGQVGFRCYPDEEALINRVEINEI